jgi:phage terminase small subunit
MTKIPSPNFTPANRPLTLKEQTAVVEYLKTGNKSAAMRAAYKTKSKTVSQQANNFFRKPKIIDALQKALKDSKFDDDYAIKTMKKIVDAGMENIEITRPDTALKVLETYFKITNKMGGGNKDTVRMDPETVAKKMDTSELLAVIKELGKREKRILEIMRGVTPKLEEGEIL